jgi:hypothetical protein
MEFRPDTRRGTSSIPSITRAGITPRELDSLSTTIGNEAIATVELCRV